MRIGPDQIVQQLFIWQEDMRCFARPAVVCDYKSILLILTVMELTYQSALL